MNAETREFINLYNQLESLIRSSYDLPKDAGPIYWLSHSLTSFRDVSANLDYIRRVRNLLSHCGLVNGDYPVTPSAGMLETLRETISKVRDIPNALRLCIETRDIYAASMSDCIRPAMREMAEKVFTHVPILEDGRVVGVFSENTLLAYMNTSNIVVISENDTFEKVRDFLPLDRHVSEKFAFVSRGTIATEVVKLFQDSLARRERVGMVFVTEHGEPDEELLGILTAWDMAAFF